MRATRFPDRASASQAEQADARAALRAAGTPSGLYDPALEKDSCGVGFIAISRAANPTRSSTTR